MPTQPNNRLYSVTAKWQEKEKNFMRDFIICAETKQIAEKIAQNHIPQQLMRTDTQPSNLTFRVRDLGTPANRRTYHSSEIKSTDRTAIDEPSPFECILTQMSILWGNELGYRIALQNKQELSHDEELALYAMQNEKNPTETLLNWTKEYLISTNTTIESFFHLQLKNLSHTNIKAPKTIANTTSDVSIETIQQAKETAHKIEQTAQTNANDILDKATKDADQIIKTAETKRDLLLQKVTEETESKLEQFHQYLNLSKSAIDKASAMVFGIEKLYKQVTNDQYRIIEEMQHLRNPKDRRSIWDMIYTKPDDTTKPKENPYTIVISNESLEESKQTETPDFHITKSDIQELLKDITPPTANTDSTENTLTTDDALDVSEPEEPETLPSESEIQQDEHTKTEETDEPNEKPTDIPNTTTTETTIGKTTSNAKPPKLTLNDISIESMISVLKMYSIPTNNGTKVNGYTWLTTVAKNANRLDILESKLDLMKTLQRTAPVNGKNGWIYLLTQEYRIEPSEFQLTTEEQKISDAGNPDIPKLEDISDTPDEETVIT